MKENYTMKFGIGIFAVLVLVVLQAMFGFVTGASGLIPIEADPTLMLIGVAGILTVAMLMIFLFVKATYMKK